MDVTDGKLGHLLEQGFPSQYETASPAERPSGKLPAPHSRRSLWNSGADNLSGRFIAKRYFTLSYVKTIWLHRVFPLHPPISVRTAGTAVASIWHQLSFRRSNSRSITDFP